jgi:hypothetical protein
MTKILFLIVLYTVMLIFLWGASKFFLYMESLGRQMIDNGFVIKAGSVRKGHPAKDTPVGKFYSYYYFCIAVGGKWIVWGMAIFAMLLFCAQIISVVTTGQYFRGNPLFAKMPAL